MRTTLLLLRHGQTTWNAERRWQGWADAPLSPLGEQQALDAAAHLVDAGLTRVCSSDLSRAQRTAELVADGLGLRGSVFLDAGLRERDVGVFSGRLTTDLVEEYPECFDPDTGRAIWIPESEATEALVERAMDALVGLATRWPSDRLLVVSHGGLIGAVERHLGLVRASSVPNLGGRWLEVLDGGAAVVGGDEYVPIGPELRDRAALGVSEPDETGEAHGRFLRSRPRREGLRAMVDDVEPGVSVLRVRRLKGGLEAATHRVDLETRSGARRSVVLRRFNDSFRWFDPERLPREVALLQSLAPTVVPAPELQASDVEGQWFGSPALVVSCLRGGPSPYTTWVDRTRELAAAMAAIHDVHPAVDAEPWLTGWRRDEPPQSLAGDPWLERVWPVIQSNVEELAASGGDALVHHDLHPGNALWWRGKLSGIVDWPMAGRGFPAYDRAYLCLDVSLCLGLEAGDAVRAWFEPMASDSPAWDLVVGLRALPDPDLWVSVYRELGAPVTEAEGRARLAAWFERAMAALR